MFNKTNLNLIFILPILFCVVQSLKIQEDEEEQSILLKLKNEFENPSEFKSWNSNNSHHCSWE
ncbi:hypothetical protein MKX03_028547, partial [Papaver bracteatum]